MPVIPMQKVVLLAHKDEKDQIFKYLQESELLEVTPPPFVPEKVEELVSYEGELAELKSAINFLEVASGEKKSFLETFVPKREVVAPEVLRQTAEELNWKEIVKKVEENKIELTNLKNLETKLKEDLANLAPWQNLGISLSQLTVRGRICRAAGSCLTKMVPELKRKLEKFSSAQHLEIFHRTREKTYLLIFYLAAEEKPISDLLSKSGFEKVVFPISEKTPAGERDHLKQLLRETAEKRKGLLKEIGALLKHKTQLTYVYDYLFQKENERKAREKAVHTPNTFILTGWVPKKKFEKLKAGLAKTTSLAEVEAIFPEKDEVPPTLIENPKVFYPFETITRIFGLPSQKEMDPTGPLAFFYLLYFAMCLSDVGYGIILSLFSFFLLRRLTLSEGGRKLLLLLFWGGIATIGAGILTGGYLGLDLNTIPPQVGNTLKRLQVVDPIKSPLNVLIISLGLGVIQNLFGLGLAMYWKIKNREYLSGILDYGLWIFFLSSLVIFGVSTALKSPLANLFSRLAISGAVLLVLTQGRSEPNIFKKVFSGILSLYRTTSYLGDTLSYSRLLALMMTTSIIGMVVNIIAVLTKDSIPILGYAIMFLVLVLGHAFNLIVSVLGAFIHSARLQLVEFFGKFYEGGGKEFRPFRRETRYVIIR